MTVNDFAHHLKYESARRAYHPLGHSQSECQPDAKHDCLLRRRHSYRYHKMPPELAEPVRTYSIFDIEKMKHFQMKKGNFTKKELTISLQVDKKHSSLI